MDPRRTQEQIGLFPTPSPTADEIARLRAEAVAMRDAQSAARLKGAFSGVGRVLAAIGDALASWPQRRATYENLRRLTDRELSDIGLTRGDIARVFDPDCALPARPANATPARPSRAQAPAAGAPPPGRPGRQVTPRELPPPLSRGARGRTGPARPPSPRAGGAGPVLICARLD